MRRCRPAPARCRANRGDAASSRSVRSCSPPIPNMICRSVPRPTDPAARGHHVLEEVVGLVGARRDPERLDGEAGVANPRVPVVPVAAAAHGLRQRGRRRRADRSGRLVRQRVEHAAALVYEVAPRPLVRLVQLRPRFPRRDGVFEVRADLGLAPDPGDAPLGTRAMVQREPDVISVSQRQSRRRGAVGDRQPRRARQHENVGATHCHGPAVSSPSRGDG